MTTGYKLKPEKMRVNSVVKANKIVQDLRWQGRHAFYERISAARCEYHVYYWNLKGVI